MKRIGIVAALPAELKPLVREWPRTDHVSIGFLGDRHCFAASAGMGAGAATRAFAAIREAAGEPLDALVSYGWAGALGPGLQPGEVWAVAEVADARTGERFFAAAEGDARLVTLDHVAGREEKRALRERYEATLVDMEAATVARLARAHGLAFLCLKGVSDGADDELAGLNRFITNTGQMRSGAFAFHAALRPRSWGPLLRLGRSSRTAAEALAGALPGMLARL